MASHIRKFFRLKNSLFTRNNGTKLLFCERNLTCEPVNSDIDQKNKMFDEEYKRQIESVKRIEKIVVKVNGPPSDVTVYMNQDMSTPYDCAKHVTEHILDRAALALVDSVPWDMHKPLTSSCDLKFLYFDDPDPEIVNKAFWESCSIILGATICQAFKDNITVHLHSYPTSDYNTGSFVYDVKLSIENWNPSKEEVRILSCEMVKFILEGHKFERLDVSREFALDIMQGNPYKENQINYISSDREDGKVTLYRLGRHIDVCNGPLISHTKLIQQCDVTAVHRIESNSGLLYRFQGVAIPKPLKLNQVAFLVISKRAMKLNPGPVMYFNTENALKTASSYQSNSM